MNNLIERTNGFIVDHFLVGCDCHSEYIEFLLFEKDEDEDEQYFYLDYYGSPQHKHKDNGGFCFTKQSLNNFKEKLKALYNYAGSFSIEDADKVNHKGRTLLVQREQEVQSKCCYDVNNPKFYYYNILLYRNGKDFKKRKCLWEIILSFETHKQLIARLGIMLNHQTNDL